MSHEMRSLTTIACTYGSGGSIAAACGAKPGAIAIGAIAGIVHALIASHHGIVTGG